MASAINIPVYSDALVVLGTAGVIVPLVRRWGLNPVIGYLAAGILLGPLGIGTFVGQLPFLYWLTVSDVNNVAAIADLGVVFLLFLIGLELSFDRLLAMRRLVFGLGGLQIGLSTVAIAGVALGLGLKAPAAVVLGASLALSSTAIVLEVLAGSGRLKSNAGRACFSVLLAQDLAVIPILMLVSILGANTGASVTSTVLRALMEALLAVAIIVVVGRLLLRPLFRLVGNMRSSELFIAASLFVIVATGVIAALAGLSMALGAFIAGLLLAETEYRKTIEATIEPFKGLLLGIFFFTVGMGIDLREVVREPAALFAGALALVTIKALIVVAAARLMRLSWPAATEAALLLGPGGEFAFVSIGLASSLGVVTPRVAAFAFILTSLTMVLIPLLAMVGRRWAPLLERPAELAPELAALPSAPGRHAIVVGYGRVGQVACGLLREHGVPFVATDHDAEVVTLARRAGREVFFGEAANPDFLKACGLGDASGVIITIATPSTTDDVVVEVRKSRPDVLIVARARDADHARDLYAIGVTDAVPETIESSLQLSEAALIELGVPTGKVIASIHEERDRIRNSLQAAAKSAGRTTMRGIRSKSGTGS
jgi:CPA2 family monovalent cation:H+ antiporter-2